MKLLVPSLFFLAAAVSAEAEPTSNCEPGETFNVNIRNPKTGKCLVTKEVEIEEGANKTCTETVLVMDDCEENEDQIWIVEDGDIKIVEEREDGEEVERCIALDDDNKPELQYCDSDNKLRYNCDPEDENPIEDEDGDDLCFSNDEKHAKDEVPTFVECEDKPTIIPGHCDKKPTHSCEPGHVWFETKKGLCPEWDCRKECQKRPKCKSDQKLNIYEPNGCKTYTCVKKE